MLHFYWDALYDEGNSYNTQPTPEIKPKHQRTKRRARATRVLWRILRSWRTMDLFLTAMKILTWFGGSPVIASIMNTNSKLIWRLKKHLWRKQVYRFWMLLILSNYHQLTLCVIIDENVRNIIMNLNVKEAFTKQISTGLAHKCPLLSHFVLPEQKIIFSLQFVLPWQKKALVLSDFLGICPPLAKKNPIF